MELEIPKLSLILLVGASGSGKTTFAAKHFKETEVVSSDHCRALLSDDPNNQNVTPEAFELLYEIARKRLRLGNLTVVDATNIRPDDRQKLIHLAKQAHALPVAIVLNMPERVCQQRNGSRADRILAPYVIRKHITELRRSLKFIRKEGFARVHILNSPEDAEEAKIRYVPLWCDLREKEGPFDIIGDVHGCLAELKELLLLLGYREEESEEGALFRHPEGRTALFLGDLVDRGPEVAGVLELVMNMTKAGTALALPGNHEAKLLKKMRGKDVKVGHGLAETLNDLEKRDDAFRSRVKTFLDSLISHYVLDGGRLVAAHAGMKEHLQGRGSSVVRDFALYGETTGETDEIGLPVRLPWAEDYRGEAFVVYGHTPVVEPEWINNTVNIDTGCVFGGKLTALRYPERTRVSVKAHRTYFEHARPFANAHRADRIACRDLLDIRDVSGRKQIHTREGRDIVIREEYSAAALEAISRFAIHPSALLYLPPTMSPPETTEVEGYLEHPEEAFDYYASRGVEELVCEEKHMGSRAILLLGRTEKDAAERFGIKNGRGAIHSRTGRPFFKDVALREELLKIVAEAAETSGLWDELETRWLLLDAEIMPWSLKASELIQNQYERVGISANHSLETAAQLLQKTRERGVECEELQEKFEARLETARLYRRSYLPYTWEVKGSEDIRIAPFHILASEGATHFEKEHAWHLAHIDNMCEAAAKAGRGDLLLKTGRLFLRTDDPESRKRAVEWWNKLTESGGEGMVVKPANFLARQEGSLLQPAIKCRGREYLRIIYGPEYTLPSQLKELRNRGTGKKRSLAMQEFLLGMEALQRYVSGEPLHRVHECVFGLLALESEPVDPTL